MLAPAKINLDLRITGRRDDGYHLLDSIVVFTDFGDELIAEPADRLRLEISGAFAEELRDDDNLIIKAVSLLCDEAGVVPNIKFKLTKNLPISSGIGGGSSDAAAALKLTNQLLDLNFADEQLKKVALSVGADVPVCINATATKMTGIGEILTPVKIQPDLPILLVNPGVSLSTAAVFSNFHETCGSYSAARMMQFDQVHWPLMLDHLVASTNDLQEPACVLNAEVSEVLTELASLEGNLLTRMSGSGATCFAIFDDISMCNKAKILLSDKHSGWWIRAGRIR